MTHVDLEKLPRFLTAQRWFGGKAWPIKNIELIDHVELAEVPQDGGGAALALVEVRYEVGTPERYLLVVAPLPDGTVAGALSDDGIARALLDLIRHGQERPSASGRLSGERLPGAERVLDTLSATPHVRRPMTEQTHTSIVFDEKVILKVIRKLELGRSPEYEVGRFLASHGSFRATPPLLGALQLEGRAGTTLALLHEFIPNQGDGWTWLLSRLREDAPADRIAREMRALGARVGELHVALGSDPDDPAFAPEPILLEDLQRWSSSIIGELGVTLSEASQQFPRVIERRNAALERARRLAHLSPSGMKIRIHGDLHLGQVLRGEEGWLIFDFEGEPARKLPQRREKQSPLKDVAGMMRSLDYAGTTLAFEGRSVGGLITRARRELLEGYREATRGSGLLPEAPADFDGVLDAFELEKLLYEVRYEISHRPEWASIPIQALMQPEESP